MGRPPDRWLHSAQLALICAALYWVNIPYRAGFFGIENLGSLAHLQTGFLLAIALLYRDKLPLLACSAAILPDWFFRVYRGGGAEPIIYLQGTMGVVITYLILRQIAHWLAWPRRGVDSPFLVSDVWRFALLGMFVLPLLLVAMNSVLGWLLVPVRPSAEMLANEQTQVLFAKFFGVLILTLPMMVLVTHERASTPALKLSYPVIPWRLLVLGVLAPVVLLRTARFLSFDIDAVLATLLGDRLLIAAALVWCALRLPLRWSMPLLVAVELLFVTGLSAHASVSTHLLDVAALLRIAVECMILQLLVVLVLLYNSEREAAAAQHERDSQTEPLTGLPNLAALRLRCAAATLPPLGFLLLDRIEKVSAGLGLRAQAAILRWVADQVHGVADAFYIGTGQLVLLPTVAIVDEQTWTALLQSVQEPEFICMGRRIRALPYLGLADFDGYREDLDERIQRAADAATEAKLRGELTPLRAGNREDDHARSRQRLTLQLSTTILSRIRAGEVELYFQPIMPLRVAIADGSVSGEVLCRLRNEAGQLLLPAQFLPELQANRRVAELDLAVLRRLSEWVGEHLHELPPIGYISVNIGSQSLASREFARELLSLVENFPLPPQRLCFEVTETAAITHADESTALLTALRERGCQIAIDDFGVGFQSFERLKQIPVDVIKIDGSFVSGMTRSSRDYALVHAAVMVARAFNAETVAEYVEDEATAAALRELLVDWGQGHYFAEPLPIMHALLGKGAVPNVPVIPR